MVGMVIDYTDMRVAITIGSMMLFIATIVVVGGIVILGTPDDMGMVTTMITVQI